MKWKSGSWKKQSRIGTPFRIKPLSPGTRTNCERNVTAMKLTELERIHVGYLDTPLEYMPNLTKELGKGKLYVKRDDMTGLAFGGNKARKLDYLVKDALGSRL